MRRGSPRSRIADVSVLCTTAAFVSGCIDAGQPSPDSESQAPVQIHFADVTKEAGLSGFEHVTGAFGKKWFPETMGSGLAVIDFNNDGWLDLMVAGGGVWDESGVDAPPVVRLYENESGIFKEVDDGIVPTISA